MCTVHDALQLYALAEGNESAAESKATFLTSPTVSDLEPESTLTAGTL